MERHKKSNSNLDPYSIMKEKLGLPDKRPISSDKSRKIYPSSYQGNQTTFTNGLGGPANLNVFKNEPIFLILSGPSLTSLNLEEINRVGAMSFGVNNSWHTFKPNFWTCADTPNRFLYSRWLDPKIMKLVPGPLKGLRLRKQVGNTLVESDKTPLSCPNVFFYQRNLQFNPNLFLREKTVNWGGHSKKKDVVDVKGARSVMLSAIKLCYVLGFRTIYLCGADFNMEEGQQNYAFEQSRTNSAIKGNNNSYKANIKRLKSLEAVFNKGGLKIFNCNPKSRLDAFPFISFGEAITKCESRLIPLESSKGWYDKEAKKMKVKRK